MVVHYAVKGDSFVAGKPFLWTDTRFFLPNGQRHMDLAPDGNRFAVFSLPETTAQDKGSVRVTFLVNFVDELPRRLPEARVSGVSGRQRTGTPVPPGGGRGIQGPQQDW